MTLRQRVLDAAALVAGPGAVRRRADRRPRLAGHRIGLTQIEEAEAGADIVGPGIPQARGGTGFWKLSDQLLMVPVPVSSCSGPPAPMSPGRSEPANPRAASWGLNVPKKARAGFLDRRRRVVVKHGVGEVRLLVAVPPTLVARAIVASRSPFRSKCSRVSVNSRVTGEGQADVDPQTADPRRCRITLHQEIVGHDDRRRHLARLDPVGGAGSPWADRSAGIHARHRAVRTAAAEHVQPRIQTRIDGVACLVQREQTVAASGPISTV